MSCRDRDCVNAVCAFGTHPAAKEDDPFESAGKNDPQATGSLLHSESLRSTSLCFKNILKKNFSFSGVFLTLIYYFFSNEEVTYFELSSVSKKRQATEIHERYDEYSTNIR